tara:strand:+ start:196 stop:417 length:222 start_codon:yes stop_codon:yes gene_type:complete
MNSELSQLARAARALSDAKKDNMYTESFELLSIQHIDADEVESLLLLVEDYWDELSSMDPSQLYQFIELRFIK